MEQRAQLQRLAAEVLGLEPHEVPSQLVFNCDYEKLARAITMRNAVHVLERFIRGEPVWREDEPWHTQYIGRLPILTRELERTGYLNAEVN
jgi:hypothetical protein